jgi:hypothetical protein
MLGETTNSTEKVPEISTTSTARSSPISQKAMNSTDSALFLQGLVISIIPVKIPKARVDLLCKRIHESGGATTCFRLEGGSCDPSTTHCLVDDSVDAEALLSLLETNKFSQEKILETLDFLHWLPCRWISSCLSSRSHFPETNLTLNCKIRVRTTFFSSEFGNNFFFGRTSSTEEKP